MSGFPPAAFSMGQIMFKRKPATREKRLLRQVAELQSELEAERRRLAVSSAEIESLAAVIARDRARIQAEAAAYARRQADAEGVQDERAQQSVL